MRLILFTKQKFLINELKKSPELFTNIVLVDSFLNLFDLVSNDSTILYHLDCDENYENNSKLLFDEFKDLKVIALRDHTNNIEGCRVLKKGFKAYAHAISNVNIIENIITSVNGGNTWMYPELMQFLISSVPENDKTENELLERISIKELEVLELVAQGYNNADIAKILQLAEVTVKKHISSMFKKLEVKDRLSLALVFKNLK